MLARIRAQLWHPRAPRQLWSFSAFFAVDISRYLQGRTSGEQSTAGEISADTHSYHLRRSYVRWPRAMWAQMERSRRRSDARYRQSGYARRSVPSKVALPEEPGVAVEPQRSFRDPFLSQAYRSYGMYQTTSQRFLGDAARVSGESSRSNPPRAPRALSARPCSGYASNSGSLAFGSKAGATSVGRARGKGLVTRRMTHELGLYQRSPKLNQQMRVDIARGDVQGSSPGGRTPEMRVPEASDAFSTSYRAFCLEKSQPSRGVGSRVIGQGAKYNRAGYHSQSSVHFPWGVG